MKSSNSNGSGGELSLRLEQTLSQLCLLGQLNEQVALLDDMPALCLSILGAIIEFTSAENASIMLSEPNNGNLKLLVAKGKGDKGSFLGRDNLSTTILRPGQGAAGLAVVKGQVITVDDCANDGRFAQLDSSQKEISSVICAPIVFEGATLGVINCSHPNKQHFADKDRETVSIVAEHAAILLHHAFAFELCQRQPGKSSGEKVEAATTALEEADLKIKRLEKHIYRLEQFATLGELLGGVAHELNNRIAPIIIYSEIMQQTTIDPADEKRLRSIEESALAMKTIVETLRTCAQIDTREPQSVDLNKTIRNALALTEFKMRKHGIELSLDIQSEFPMMRLNEQKMAQVFLNVINNAIHAMEPKGGTLTIQSSADRETVRFLISDTGPGVPDEIREKIFEPFFTTKDSGKGTGLGLSISRRYVEEHGGKMYIAHSSSGGAKLVVELPRTDVQEEKKPATQPGPDKSKQPVKILVVDDDPTIREVIRDVLGPRYLVEFAEDGRAATDMIKNNPFDMLVVDYHMPGFDGKQLYEWVLSNHPSLKSRIVFSTGDMYHENIRTFIENTGCRYLTKPFSTKSLREIVSQTLAA